MELKKLSRHCGYGENLSVNLRDTRVGGLANPKIQAKLLQKGEKLTWENACNEALAMETAMKDSRHIISNFTSEAGQNVPAGAASGAMNRVTTGKECYRCLGTDHGPRNCPYKADKCLAVQKLAI